VAAIAVEDRNQLLTALMTITDTERRRLAEDLHDNALQYLLAARFDLEYARETAEPAAFDRLDQALTQSAQLLRTTVSELHPAVLEQSGLAAAVSGPARTAAGRAGLELDLDVTGWPPTARTRPTCCCSAPHANCWPTSCGTPGPVTSGRRRIRGATDRSCSAGGRLDLRTGGAELGLSWSSPMTVSAPTRRPVAGRLAEGHIGLNSHRIRIEAAGGTFTLRTPPSGGTVVAVSVPVALAVAVAVAVAATATATATAIAT
jgi:two-component system NarL family sensor kinase